MYDTEAKWLCTNISLPHYRWPLIVFVAYLVGVSVLMRKLPPVTRNSEEIRERQFKASRMGWIYVAGLVLGTLNFLSGGAKAFRGGESCWPWGGMAS